MQAESMGLSKLIQKKKMNIVGIMSGTSLDGIDFVLIEASKKSSANVQVQYKDRVHVEFPEEMKFKLAQAARQELERGLFRLLVVLSLNRAIDLSCLAK